ncbi:MAG TPA: response regulator transcription factor [Anaerolineales bacterium]|nr:response regulator transcription factor [Anaerolineales bacterium]
MQNTPATILVIERHPLMRAAIVNTIVDEPNLTIAAIASEGSDTLHIIESLRPEIILFSIGNPGEDDLRALLELRKHSLGAALLALTTNEVPGQDEAARKHGADVVLAKTAPRAELLHTLRAMKARVEYKIEIPSVSQRRDAG